MAERMKLLPWGPKVIGKERFEKQKEFVARKQDKYGYKLVGDRPPINGAQPDPQRVMIGGDLSLEKLEEVLGRNPHFVATLLEKEINRPRGARVKALHIIRSHVPVESAQKATHYKRIDALLKLAKGDTGLVYDPEIVKERKKAESMRAKKDRAGRAVARGKVPQKPHLDDDEELPEDLPEAEDEE